MLLSAEDHPHLPNLVQISIFWLVQASAVLVFAVPFRWAFVALWAASHFLRAIGLTVSLGVAFHFCLSILMAPHAQADHAAEE